MEQDQALDEAQYRAVESPGVDYEGCDAYIRERAERFPCKGGKKCLGDVWKGESTFKHIYGCPARNR